MAKIDMENVIKADAVVLIKCIAKCRAEDKRILEHDDDAMYQCPTCTFYRHGCKNSLMERASNTIESLLKEQEAVKPRVSSVEQRCGNCNKVIEMDEWKACPWCGKPILWEAVGRQVK